MTSVSTLSFLKSRLFKVKFHFGHKITFLKLRLYVILRLYVKSRLVKSRLYCISQRWARIGFDAISN